jgi:hypothetical protein
MSVISLLRTLTKHDSVFLTPSGDASIFAALVCCSKGKVLIPAEGGWLSYEKFGKLLGKEVVFVKTNDALIDVDDLKLKVTADSVFLYNNPGGYIVDQPAREIFDVCKNAGCLVLMDVSGSIGSAYADGSFADILVCSFGKWKVVDAGYGGFVSARDGFEDKDIFRMLKFYEGAEEIILDKLESIQTRLEKIQRKRKEVISDLREMDVLHAGKWGLNVVVKFSSEDEMLKIVDYCKSKGLEWTLCPRYIRVNSNAVSIEVKRIL